jgi:hypothetical protein
MLLRKLAWPARLVSLTVEFGLDYSSASRIITYMATTLMQLYGASLDLWPGLTPARIAQCAAAITAYTPGVIDTWGFIDGTSRRIARPVVHQRVSYSGFKRGHLQNYQGIVTPDGLIVSLMGPFVGSKNDLNMLAETGLEARIAPLVCQQGRTLLLYGDLIYKGQSLVMRGFEAATDPMEQRYNDLMNGLRVHIETAFGRITQLFAGTDLRRVERTGLSPTAAYYCCCVLFTNIDTCMHPENTNIPWLLMPPTVEEYLS